LWGPGSGATVAHNNDLCALVVTRTGFTVLSDLKVYMYRPQHTLYVRVTMP